MPKGKKNNAPRLGEMESTSPRSVFEDIMHEGARTMLQAAMENEVAEFVRKHARHVDENGHRLVVKNGSMPERGLLTPIGKIRVKQPRIDDREMRDEDGYESFTSQILPKYMRRVPSINNLIPMLYLKGISTGDFPRALEAILGKDAPGLSAANVVRLKAQWEEEYKDWAKRDLSEKEYVYIGRTGFISMSGWMMSASAYW